MFYRVVCVLLILAAVAACADYVSRVADESDSSEGSNRLVDDFKDMPVAHTSPALVDLLVLVGSFPKGYKGTLVADGDGYAVNLFVDPLIGYFVMNNGSVKFSIELADPGALEGYMTPSVLDINVLSTNQTLSFCFYQGPGIKVDYCSAKMWKPMVSAPEGTSVFNFLIKEDGTVDVQAAGDVSLTTLQVVPWTGQKLGNESIAVQFEMRVWNNWTVFTARFARGSLAVVKGSEPSWWHEHRELLICLAVVAGGCAYVFLILFTCWRLKCWIF